VTYYVIGEKTRAMESVSVNVDFDIEHEISGVVLQNMRDGTLDSDRFSDTGQSALIASRRGYGEDAPADSAELGLIAWFRGDAETASRLMNGALESSRGNADPLPYHVLSFLASIPDAAGLRKSRDAAAATAPEIAYEALRPIVERYAENGSDNAKNFFGDMYLKGLGISADVAEAVKLYEGAAESGSAYARGMLGEIYETKAEMKDEAASAAYYTEAARQGLPWAALRLGDMYRDGRGIGQKNLEDAYMWYSVAAMSGEPSAQNRIDSLDGKGILKMKSVSGATAQRARARALEIYEGFSEVKP
jgi:TPR repeat protein